MKHALLIAATESFLQPRDQKKRISGDENVVVQAR